jgi:hypothetical protein
MAYNVTSFNPHPWHTGFVIPDYKISIREDLPGAIASMIADRKQDERIRKYMSKYSGVPNLDDDNIGYTKKLKK